MRGRGGARGQFNILYGTPTLRLEPDFAYLPGGPRPHWRLVHPSHQPLADQQNWTAPVHRGSVQLLL